MKIAVDSNRYSDLLRGAPKAIEIFETATEIYFPLIVIAELRAGFAQGTQAEQNERNLMKVLNQEAVYVLSPDVQTTFHYAKLYAQLRKQGKPIPTNDLWIAALVIQHQLILFDRDSDFDHMPQLVRIPWRV